MIGEDKWHSGHQTTPIDGNKAKLQETASARGAARGSVEEKILLKQCGIVSFRTREG